MMKHLSQVDQGHNIRHGMLSRKVKTQTIFLLESTNNLSLKGCNPLSRILLTPMIAFEPCWELTNFPSGVLDVGYVYLFKKL